MVAGRFVRSLARADLTHVLDHTRDVWNDLRNARVFITGGSGFVGSWLLETLLHANTELALGIRVTALVRDREQFAQRLPQLATSSAVRIHVGDVRVVDPPARAFTHFVHCASALPPAVNTERPDEVVDIIERGTTRVVEEAESGKGGRFLQVSSGSVYGVQSPDVPRIDETARAVPDVDDPAQRFGAAKRRAELRGEASVAHGVGFVSARVFALVGPRLPLDGQFAIGNFLGDALAARPVRVTGDGTPVRSWMHAADMAGWCWTLLVRGKAGAAYNVGSEEEHTLWDAAQRVAALPEPPVRAERAREPDPAVRPSPVYVPSIRRALREELGARCVGPLRRRVAGTCNPGLAPDRRYGNRMTTRERHLNVGSRRIGPNEPCYVIAEIGLNHNGDLAIAKRLVDVAVEAGVDAVKFQKRKLTEILPPGNHRAAAARRAGTAVHRPAADRIRTVG